MLELFDSSKISLHLDECCSQASAFFLACSDTNLASCPDCKFKKTPYTHNALNHWILYDVESPMQSGSTRKKLLGKKAQVVPEPLISGFDLINPSK